MLKLYYIVAMDHFLANLPPADVIARKREETAALSRKLILERDGEEPKDENNGEDNSDDEEDEVVYVRGRKRAGTTKANKRSKDFN